MRRLGARLLLAGLLASLAACVTPPARRSTSSAIPAAQSERERILAARTHWVLEGRLGVANAHDSGSGSLSWQQDGANYRFTVHAPVTGRTWVLSGDAAQARLDGLRDGTLQGRDAADLLQRELGWQVPFAQLVAWVRALRAPGPAQMAFDAQGLPAQIEQDGWTIRYGDYDMTQSPPLPRRVFASRGEERVRLAIRSWQP
ncbi:MAG: lipoprotein insertase outer membrane protein LolB [Dokdonella sp.]|uniref:lipoprotein insertase outer membrane protein LolB n=1 Tax=Dokdonella sp. TaxID=2291710 RepID=UPI0025BFFCE0|nr:lipoprotein insertase outer membrane protein LolB [Dokdonella sp.]MBX3699529.1 lipoprotein insertase outer membrane protein LolB [Dokdonella sp.]MCW5577388.1 lipoprotein insertase outer membrane protein LolB [Dokdonella sp.]